MINKSFYDWLVELAHSHNFVTTTAQTDEAVAAQAGVELALRFFAFLKVPYKRGLDVHEYLDFAMESLLSDQDFDLATNSEIFHQTFEYLDNALGEMAFKRWDGESFKGKFRR